MGRSPEARVSTQPGFRPDIEGLRGIAVFLVVAFHAGVPGWSGGFVGVDVFFVISGYLITNLLVDELERSGKIDFIRFYARRARRLVPASLLVTSVTVLVGLFILSPLELKEVAKAAVLAILFASNILFMTEATDYFAADTETNPLLHMWSLSVEEQFYFFWPVLILLVFRGLYANRNLILLMGVVFVCSLVGCIYFTEVQQPWAFFGMPLRAWEFAIGAIACLAPRWMPAPLVALQHRSGILGWFGLTAIVASGVWFSNNMGFPGALATIPTLGTAALLMAGRVAPEAHAGRLLCTPFLRLLGRLSYSWYLWHWPVLIYGTVLFHPMTLGERCLGALLSLVLAGVTYLLVEDPIRRNRTFSRRNGWSVVVASFAIVVGSVATYGTYNYAKNEMWSPNVRAIAEVTEGIRKDKECNIPATEVIPKECVFGHTASKTTFVLFGDSHAFQWLPAMKQIASRNRWRLVTLIKTGCPSVDVPVYAQNLKREYHECARWREAALKRISEMRPVAIMLGNFSNHVQSPGEIKSQHPRPSVYDWHQGLQRTLARLAPTADFLLVLRDNPTPGLNVPICLSRAAWHHDEITGKCQLDRKLVFSVPLHKAEIKAVQEISNASFIDLSDHHCSGAICHSVKNGIIVYRDEHHLSEPHVLSLSTELEHQILPIMEGRRTERRVDRN